MTGEYLLMLAARWLHILAAALAIGVPWYVRLVLMPALGTLEEEQRARLREALAKRWRMIVHLLIVVFLASGLYNFLVVARWRGWLSEQIRTYHMIFGIKLVLALALFTISEGLAGRSAMFASMRQKAGLWMTILILLGLAIIGVSGILRSLP